MRFVYLLFFVVFIQYSSETPIENDIVNYFNSDKLTSFRTRWNQFRRAFDDAISLTLKDDYADNVMNIYMAHQKKNLIISHGLYASDSSIQLICQNLVLRALPRLKMPAVNVALPSNVIRVEALVEKMFLDTQYRLYRNETCLLDQGEQDPLRDSPFSFQQVQNEGDVTIIVEDCILIGTIVTSLVGHSVSLGHDTIRLTECKFSVEISARHLEEPPVIAPYFSNEKGLELMQLLSKPIRDWLRARLQGTVLSYINTTDVFGGKLDTYRKMQRKIFQLTRDYTLALVNNINQITVERKQCAFTIDDFLVSLMGKKESTIIELANVTVTGLETAYSANNGGPYKLKTPKLSQAINFNSLQVRGSMRSDNFTTSAISHFAAEVIDYTITVSVEFTEGKTGKEDVKFAPQGWRSLEFSIIHLDAFSTERAQIYSLITGYLSENIPKKLVKHLSTVYKPAVDHTNKEGAYRANKKDEKSNKNEREEVHQIVSDEEVHQIVSDEEVHQIVRDAGALVEQEKRPNFKRNVVSQSEHEEERIAQKRNDKNRN